MIVPSASIRPIVVSPAKMVETRRPPGSDGRGMSRPGTASRAADQIKDGIGAVVVSGAQRIDRVHGLAVVHLLGAQAASLPGVAADGRDHVRAARARHLHRVAAGDRRDSRRYDWSVQ